MAFHLERNKPLYEELVAKYPECPALWRYFVALTEVPRPSGSTKRASEWAVECGKKLGATVKTDAIGNVSILIPATKGKEGKPAVVLQAHLDMVGTKTADHKHEFTSDPIHAFIDGDKLRAHNTTLGADDGSGVAACLAIAEDKTLSHGPIEILFTIDEETGLQGALKLKEGELLTENAKYLINVDSEDWGEITLSCAGGVDRILSIPVVRSPLEANWNRYELNLRDFRGGHTGVEIHAGRANAIKWAVSMLLENREAISGCPIRIANIKGGNAHNAIPSHVNIEFALPADRAAAFISSASDIFHLLNLRYASVEKVAGIKEPKFEIIKATAAAPESFLSYSSSRTALCFLESIHHGIWKWSEEVPSLVETSQSLSLVKLTQTHLEVEVFARSSINETLTNLSKLLDAFTAVYGGKCVPHSEDSPGWPAEPNSHLCKTAMEIYRKHFKAEPKLVPIHAGLECGIIINKFPKNKIEAISIGPTVRSPHTVDEFMELPTAVHLYKFLYHLVEALSN